MVLLAACGEGPSDHGATSAPSSPPRENLPEISAADRDSSLDAIERWLTSGRADNATIIARTLADRLPGDPHVSLALGRSLIALGSEWRNDPDRGAQRAREISCEAVEILEPAYRRWRAEGIEASEARRSLGLALEGCDRLQDAIDIYAEAKASEDPVSRFHLGLALLRAGQASEADIVLLEVGGLRPDDAFVVSARAEAALMLGDHSIARTLATQAVRLDDGSWPLRVRRASILRRSGDPTAAVESLLAMDEEARMELPALTELTEGWIALDRPATAAEAWAELASRSSDDPTASIGAAIQAAKLFAIAGMDEESITWLEIARDLDSGDARISECERRIEEIRSSRDTS